jgi:hypothetical protein
MPVTEDNMHSRDVQQFPRREVCVWQFASSLFSWNTESPGRVEQWGGG